MAGNGLVKRRLGGGCRGLALILKDLPEKVVSAKAAKSVKGGVSLNYGQIKYDYNK